MKPNIIDRRKFPRAGRLRGWKESGASAPAREWKQRPRRAGEAKEKDGKKEGSRGISGALGEEAAAVGRQGPATHKPVCGSFVDSMHTHTRIHIYIYMDV